MAHADRGEAGPLGPGLSAVPPRGVAPGRRLAQNTAFNLAGQVIPAVVAIACIPIAIHGMGNDRFGLLSIAWVLLSYLTLFDIGLGRATVRFVASSIAAGDEAQIRRSVWTSIALQVLLGSAGGLLFAAATPFLVEHALKIPASLHAEARSGFYALSVCVPVLIVSAGVRGILEASQRFDLVNAVRVVANSLIFVVPAAAALLHLSLTAAFLLLGAGLVLSGLGYVAFVLKVHPGLRAGFAFDPRLVWPLMRFGGWVTVSAVVVPILVYTDRVLLGALVSVAALTYYTVPYEMAFRLQVFPAAFGAVLFPAFASSSTVNNPRLPELYARSLKYLLVVMAPTCLVVYLFGRQILEVWIGPAFAAHSAVVFQVLAVGMLLNALSQIPAQLLDGCGRPDLRAKVFLAYTPVYVAAAWLLISHFGLIGAAIAWTARAALELVLFFAVAWYLLRPDMNVFVRQRVALAAVVVVAFLLVAVQVVQLGWFLLTAGFAIALAAALWIFALDAAERGEIRALVSTHSLRFGR